MMSRRDFFLLGGGLAGLGIVFLVACISIYLSPPSSEPGFDALVMMAFLIYGIGLIGAGSVLIIIGYIKGRKNILKNFSS